MALPKAPKARTTSSFHHFTFWHCWWAKQATRINGLQLLWFMSSLFYLTVTYHFIFSFLRIQQLCKTKTIPCWARRTFPMWFKPSGHNLLPYWVWEWKPNQAWRACLVHSLTHCWFIDSRVFSFYLQVWILDTTTRSENIEKVFFFPFQRDSKQKKDKTKCENRIFL